MASLSICVDDSVDADLLSSCFCAGSALFFLNRGTVKPVLRGHSKEDKIIGFKDQ